MNRHHVWCQELSLCLHTSLVNYFTRMRPVFKKSEIRCQVFATIFEQFCHELVTADDIGVQWDAFLTDFA